MAYLVVGAAACLSFPLLSLVADDRPLSAQQDVTSESRFSHVVVPIHDIRAGIKLTPEMFVMRATPKIELREDSLFALDQVEGYYARYDLFAGVPMRRSMLSTTGFLNTKGYRALEGSATGE